jgi:Mrp family chromosome partitioning ATPase
MMKQTYEELSIMKKSLEDQATEKMVVVRQSGEIVTSSKPKPPLKVVESSSAKTPAVVSQKSRQVARSSKRKPSSKKDLMTDAVLRERCRQLVVSLFFREHAPVRSLGLTSTLSGEGKTFLASVLASILADDSSESVVLVECNWEHPSFHEHYGLPATPGLAEWLRGECDEAAIRHQVSNHLTVIPAGDAHQDVVRLFRQLHQKDLLQTLAASHEFLLVELPPMITSAYNKLAAGLVEALLLVVRAGVTPDHLLAEACAQLRGFPVEGIVLNQVQSWIPRWVRQLL